MRTAEEIAAMSDDRRRRLRLKKYKIKPRPDFSRGQLVEYLRLKGFRSSRELVKNRGVQEPDVYDYRKEFGSWSNAIKEIFGDFKQPEVISAPIDSVNYYGDLVIKFDLWRQSDYLAARKRMPEVIPSFYHVKRKFGRYSNLVEFSRRLSLVSALNRYMVLMRRLGHKPSMKECNDYNVDIEVAIKHYGGKKQLDNFIKDWAL